MKEEWIERRLRQDGHMEIAWQHVGAAAARGEVVVTMLLCRLLECRVLGSGGRRRSEECLERGWRGGRRRRRRPAWT